MSIATPSTLLEDALALCVDRTPYSVSELSVPASRFVTWATRIAAIDPDPVRLFTRRNIERFVQQGLPNYAPASRGNMRSKLLRMSEVILDPGNRAPRLHAIQPANPLRPYSPADVVSMRAWARTQSAISRRRSATALLALGLGAGLSAAEISDTHVEEIDTAGPSVIVHVGGSRARAVPVLDDWADELRWAVGSLDRGAYAFRPHRQTSWPNVISNFVGRDVDPRPQSQRMRSSWLVGHMTAGTNVRVLVEAAGIDSLEALTRYLDWVHKPAPEAAIAQLTRAAVAA